MSSPNCRHEIGYTPGDPDYATLALEDFPRSPGPHPPAASPHASGPSLDGGLRVTQLHGSPGPLDWTATEERLARIHQKLEDLNREAGAAISDTVRGLLDDASVDAETRRDQISTRLMEAFRLHQSRAAFSCLYELNAAHLYQQ